MRNLTSSFTPNTSSIPAVNGSSTHGGNSSMTMSLSSSVNGKHKQTAYTTNDRSSTSPPDYRSESSSTSPLHMTNLDNSSRINGRIGNGGINGHSVTTLTSSTPRSGHYSHNNNSVIKETMVQ